MSAKIWVMAGLVVTLALPAAAQQTTANDDNRGRVATTIDGDAGL
jgi:hypothetical protein